MNRGEPDVTELLLAWSEGDPAARDRLVEVVQDQLRLRAIAGADEARERLVLRPLHGGTQRDARAARRAAAAGEVRQAVICPSP